METILEELIADFHERSMPDFTLLTTDRGGQKSLIQVSADIKEPVTRQHSTFNVQCSMLDVHLLISFPLRSRR